MSKIAYVSILALATAAAACASTSDSAASSDDDLRGISTSEAYAELTAVHDSIKAFYGPLDFKKAKFGFDLEQATAAAKAQIAGDSKTEGDRVRPIYELLAKLHDSHVSYQYPMPGSRSTEYDLPLLITPYEGKYLVDLMAPNTGLTRGDEVISIDGKTMQQLNDLLSPLTGEGNPDTAIIMTASMFTFRPFYVPNSLIPKAATAAVVVQHADGTQATVQLPWKATAGGLAGAATNSTASSSSSSTSAAPQSKAIKGLGVGATFGAKSNWLRQKRQILESGLGDFDQLQPFWLTQQSAGILTGIQPTAPKPATLAALGVTAQPTTDANGNPQPPAYLALGAYKYQYEGKTIMVVRIPGFEAPQSPDPNEDTYGENVAWLAALLQDNMPAATPPAPAAGAPAVAPPTPAPAADPPADVIVLDETANPGGLASYALSLASLFVTTPIPNLVQADHADRMWLNEFQQETQELASYPDFATITSGWMTGIETAYDAHKTLDANFIPLTGPSIGPNTAQDPATILGANMLAPNPNVSWNKPVLILHDNLSVSCADIFPDILQNGKVAKTFGATTMGGGGNVEPVLTQNYSQAILSLTRGMGGPYNPNGAPKLIENAGVTPDFAHPVTVDDFRAGFVDYVKDFSHTAATLTR